MKHKTCKTIPYFIFKCSTWLKGLIMLFNRPLTSGLGLQFPNHQLPTWRHQPHTVAPDCVQYCTPRLSLVIDYVVISIVFNYLVALIEGIKTEAESGCPIHIISKTGNTSTRPFFQTSQAPALKSCFNFILFSIVEDYNCLYYIDTFEMLI